MSAAEKTENSSSSNKGDWQTLLDPRSNREYYVNTLTKQTTWTNPNALQTKEWVQYADSKGRYYYMNKVTRLSSWTKPNGFDDEAYTYATGKVTKKKSSSSSPTESAEKTETKWSKHLDKVTGQPYWTDGNGNITSTDPSIQDEQGGETNATSDDGNGGGGDEEEVWAVPLDDIDSGSYTKEKIDKLMNLVESSVVKDISEIKDFSAKKLQEYLRTIQTIMSRKRNSYFIAKNLKFIEEIADRKDPQVLKHFSDSYTMRIFTEILGTPHKPLVVLALFQTLTKACVVNEKFRHKIRMECQFWDVVFDCIKIASGDPHCFNNVFTLKEKPKKGSSAMSNIATTPIPSPGDKDENSGQVAYSNLSKEDEAMVKQVNCLALKLLETLLDDPMVLTAMRDYGCICDVVECCRSHDRNISGAAVSVLKRLVDVSEPETPRLNLLLEGQYELKELFFLIKSKVPDLVSAALGNLKERIQIASFPSARSVEVDSATIWAHVQGKVINQSKPQLMYLVLSKSEIYGYNEMLTPTFKLNLKDCVLRKEMSTATSSSQQSAGPRILLSFSTLIESDSIVKNKSRRRRSLGASGKPLVQSNSMITIVASGGSSAATNTDRFYHHINEAMTKYRCRRKMRPTSSYGEPVLQTIRQRSVSIRRSRRDPHISGDHKGKSAPPAMPDRPPLFSMFASSKHVKKNVGPPKLLNYEIQDAIGWAELGRQLPYLLQLARKASSVAKTQRQATLALECVNMSLRTGSPSTMLIARDTVVNDGDYNLLSILADIVRRSSKTSDDGDDDSESSPGISAETAARILDSHASLLDMPAFDNTPKKLSPGMELLGVVSECMCSVLTSQSLILATDEKQRSASGLSLNSAKAIVQLLSDEKVMLLLSCLVVNNSSVSVLMKGLRLGIALCDAGQRDALLRSGFVRTLQFQKSPCGDLLEDAVCRVKVANAEANFYLRLGQSALSRLPVVTLIDLLRSQKSAAIVETTRTFAAIAVYGGASKRDRRQKVVFDALPVLLRTMHQTLKTILARATRDEHESRPKRDVKSRAHITSARLQVLRNCVATIEGLSSHSKFHSEIVERGSLKELIEIVGSFETLSKSLEIVSSGASGSNEEVTVGEYGVVTNMNDIVLPALQSIWNVVQVNVNESVIKAFDANAIFKLMSTVSVGAYDDNTQKLVYLVIAQIATIGGKKMQRLLFQCQVPITLGSAIAMPAMLSEVDAEKRKKMGKKKKSKSSGVRAAAQQHPHMLAAWCKLLAVLSQYRQSANQLIEKGGLDAMATLLISHRTIVQAAAVSALTSLLQNESDLQAFVLRAQTLSERSDLDPIAELGFHTRTDIKGIHDESKAILLRIVRSKKVLSSLSSRQLFGLLNVGDLVSTVSLTALTELANRLALGVMPSYGTATSLATFQDTFKVQALNSQNKKVWVPHIVVLRRPFLYLYRSPSINTKDKDVVPSPLTNPVCKMHLRSVNLSTHLIEEKETFGFRLEGKWGGDLKCLANDGNQKQFWCMLLSETIDKLNALDIDKMSPATVDEKEENLTTTTPVPGTMEYDEKEENFVLRVSEVSSSNFSSSSSSSTGIGKSSSSMAEFLLDAHNSNISRESSDVQHSDTSVVSKSNDNVLINVGKIRGASALGYDTFMTEEAISKLTELIHPSTKPSMVLRLAQLLSLLTTRLGSKNQMSRNVLSASSVIGAIMEIVVLFNDVAGTSGSNMVGTDVVSEEEAQRSMTKDQIQDTRAINSAKGKLEKKIITEKEFNKVAMFLMEASLQRLRNFQQRERASNVELSIAVKGSGLAPPDGLVVERVFVNGARELAEKLVCRLGRLYYDDGTNNDVLVAIFGPSQIMKPQADGSTKNIFVDPKWFDVRYWTVRHIVRRAFQFEKIYGFQVPLRVRFLKAFNKPSQARVASEYSMRERARDYALEALANITNPHAPYSVSACEQMLIAYGQWSISLIGKEISQEELMVKGGQNLLMDLNRIMSGPRVILADMSENAASTLLSEILNVVWQHHEEEEEDQEGESGSKEEESDNGVRRRNRKGSVARAEKVRMSSGMSAFPGVSREGSSLIEKALKSCGSNIERSSDLERINVLVHSMSIIVNQSVHNSRSNLQENGYLGSSTFIEDCVNPSCGIIKLLRRAVGYVVMSVYKQMLPDITRGPIDEQTPSLVALTRSVLNVYLGIAMSNPPTRILRGIAQQGMLGDIALLWHLGNDILSDTACFKSVRQQGYLSPRVAASLGTLYVMTSFVARRVILLEHTIAKTNKPRYGTNGDVAETLSVSSLVDLMKTNTLPGAALQSALGLSHIVNSPKRRKEREEAVEKSLPCVMRTLHAASSGQLGESGSQTAEALIGLCLALASNDKYVDSLVSANAIQALVRVACWSTLNEISRNSALQCISMLTSKRSVQLKNLANNARCMRALVKSVESLSIRNLTSMLGLLSLLANTSEKTCDFLTESTMRVGTKWFRKLFPVIYDVNAPTRRSQSSRGSQMQDSLFDETRFLRAITNTTNVCLKTSPKTFKSRFKKEPSIIAVYVKLLALSDFDVVSGSLSVLESVCDDHITKKRVLAVHGMKGLKQIINLTHGRTAPVQPRSSSNLVRTTSSRTSLPPVPPSPGQDLVSPSDASDLLSKLSVKLLEAICGTNDDGVSMLHTSAELDELFALTRARSMSSVQKATKALADRVARGLHPTAHSLLMPDKVGFLWRMSSRLGMRTWRMRWIMLKDGFLYEYKGRDGSDAKNLRRKIYLAGCEVSNTDQIRDGVNSFKLIIPNVDDNMVLSAVSKPATNKWMRELKYAIREATSARKKAGVSSPITRSSNSSSVSSPTQEKISSTRRGIFGSKSVMLLNLTDGETFSGTLFKDKQRLDMLTDLCQSLDAYTSFQASRILSHLLPHFEDDKNMQIKMSRMGSLAAVRFSAACPADVVKKSRILVLEALTHFMEHLNKKKLLRPTGKVDRFGVAVERNVLYAQMTIPDGKRDIQKDDSCMYCNTKLGSKWVNCAYCKQVLCMWCSTGRVWNDTTMTLVTLCNYCYLKSSRIRLPRLGSYINCDIGREDWVALCKADPSIVQDLKTEQEKQRKLAEEDKDGK